MVSKSLEELIAWTLADSVTGVFRRGINQPIDVCRFHHELANDIIGLLKDIPIDDFIAIRKGERSYFNYLGLNAVFPGEKM